MPPMEKKAEHNECNCYNDNKCNNYNYYYPFLPNLDWFIKLTILQLADIIHSFLTTLFSPFISLYKFTSDSYRRAEEAVRAVECMILTAPLRVTQGSIVLFKALWYGFVGAVHVCMVLSAVLALAIVLGVGLVRFWVDEPILVKETVFFDYTDPNPRALFGFESLGRGGFKGSSGTRGVPVGHTFRVSLLLLVPESDYNREIGNFQVTAELLSANANVTRRASRPCMLQFRSLPVRILRTFVMSVPLVLGIWEETQKIFVELLRHNEGYPRTRDFRLVLSPRAGTSYLPQIYEAEVFINSELPWTREMVRRWKWTFYVWASICMYVLLVIILLTCYKPLLFPLVKSGFVKRGDKKMKEQKLEPRIEEFVRKWEQRRRKRKEIFVHSDHDVEDRVGGSLASSMSHSREDRSTIFQEEVGDSESVCFDG